MGVPHQPPIGTTGLLLEHISGGVDHFSDGRPILFEGSIGTTYGPKVPLEFPWWLNLPDKELALLTLSLDTQVDQNHLSATGTAEVIGNLANAAASVEINWDQGYAVLQSHFELLGGLFVTDTSYKLDSSCNLTVFNSGAVNLPVIPLTPLQGQQFAQAKGYFQSETTATRPTTTF